MIEWYAQGVTHHGRKVSNNDAQSKSKLSPGSARDNARTQRENAGKTIQRQSTVINRRSGDTKKLRRRVRIDDTRGDKTAKM